MITLIGKGSSVTRRQDYFSIFGHLKHGTFAQEYQKFAKVDSKLCKTLTKAFKNCKTLIIFAKVAKFRQIGGPDQFVPLPT